MDNPSTSDGKWQYTSPLVYQPLRAESEIRVLVLHPATRFNDPLEAHLKNRPLPQTYGEMVSQKPLPEPYEAVSYVWGAADFDYDLICDGRILKVTRSVDTVLRYLRKEQETRALWIDAVCINQNDVVEKGPQIALMGRIYETAVEVHAWLGEATPEDDIPSLFACITSLVCVEKHINKKKQEWENDPLEQFEYAEAETWDRNELFKQSLGAEGRLRDVQSAPAQSPPEAQSLTKPVGLIGMIKPYTHLFNRLLSRPWFRRRWILQEVVLAQHITVHCGISALSWTWFEKGLDLYQRIATFLPEVDSSVQQESLKSLEITVDLTKNDFTILELLWKCHTSACKEPHDRIAALLAMVSDIIPLYGIRPPNEAKLLSQDLRLRYSDPWVVSYANLAKIYLDQYHVLEMVRHIYAFGTLCELDPTWPSWVPQWHTERSVHNQTRDYISASSKIYESFPFDVDEDWRCLLWVGPVHKAPMLLHRPALVKRSTHGQINSSRESTMKRVYHLCSREVASSFLSDFPTSSSSRAQQLGKAALDIACISDASISKCIGSWDQGNPYQDLNIVAQDILVEAHRCEWQGFLAGDTFIAGSRLRREDLSAALDHFQLLLFRRAKASQHVMPCIVPAAMEPGDCIFQYVAWNAFYLVLRPVEAEQPSRPPFFRLIGICFSCSQHDDSINAWKLSGKPGLELTELEAVDCDFVCLI